LSLDPKEIACLLWDVDGTMVDTTELIVSSLDYIYRKYYHQTAPEAAIRGLIGTPLRKQIRFFGDPADYGTTEEAVTQDFIQYYEQNRDRERVLPEVTELVNAGFAKGIPTGLVTSKNREELSNTLPRLGIAGSVQVAVTADDVVHPKPAPEGILLALQRLDIPVNRRLNAVYIGDTVHDMRAGGDAGVKTIAVTWGAATTEMLKAVSPTVICADFRQLHALLGL
jgi:HAD superfamily hydrolase (TIGR01549 family)